MTSRPALHELAAYCGILPYFVDWRGNPRDTTDEARETLLAAMRLDAGTEESARRALDELRTRDGASTEVAILRARERVIEGRLPGRLHGSGEQGGEIVFRDVRGEVVRARTRMSVENDTARVAVPADVALSPGYYDAELSIDDDSEAPQYLGQATDENLRRPYSEQTQRVIDREIARLLGQAQERALALLRAHRTALDHLARLLQERETLDGAVVSQVLAEEAGDGGRGAPLRSVPDKFEAWD